MFEQFPKTRTPLPPEYQAIYAEHYKRNREGGSTASSLSSKMEAWMHRKVAADANDGATPTLEIGAGTLNHLPYEPRSTPYDIVEPWPFLYESSPHRSRVRHIFKNISDVPFDSKYQRITTIATFEHVCNLPEVVAKCALLLDTDGVLRVAIPSEGTILWQIGWQLTTGLEFRLKHKLDYGRLIRYEHVNTAAEIESVVRHFFARVNGSAFGVCKALSFYQFFECREPLLQVRETRKA